MFEIEYDITGADADEIIDPDEMSLRHKHLMGNLLLRKDDRFISIDNQRTPIIDSAFNLFYICSVLVRKKDGTEDFEISQSNKKITFQKDDGNVKIIPSFSVVTLEMPVEDYREGIKNFFRKVLQEVMRKSQSLKMNALLLRYLNEAEGI